MITSWTDGELIADEAVGFVELLSSGISEHEAAKELGIDDSVLQEWLKDDEFVEYADEEKKRFKDNIANSIKIKSNIRSKEHKHQYFTVSCNFMLPSCKTEKQKTLILKQYLSEIEKSVIAASTPECQETSTNKKK